MIPCCTQAHAALTLAVVLCLLPYLLSCTFLCNYSSLTVCVTGKALVECANKVAEQRGQPGAVVGYEEIAEAAFGKMGKALISAIIYTELFGTCCVLFILEQVRKSNLLVAWFDSLLALHIKVA